MISNREKREFINNYYNTHETIGKAIVKTKYVYLMLKHNTVFNPKFDMRYTISDYYEFLKQCK